MSDHAELDALIASLDLDYTATFVPASEAPRDDKWECVTWNVTIKRHVPTRDLCDPSAVNVPRLSTRYHSGLACLPGFAKLPQRRVTAVADNLTEALEKGKYPSDWYEAVHSPRNRWKPIPAPVLRDVLYSLCMDAEALDYSDFEEWADNFGYDTDSRKAERTYQACIAIGLKLRNMLGDANLAQLREAFQDY